MTDKMTVRNTEQTILVLLTVCAEMIMYTECHKEENKAPQKITAFELQKLYFMLSFLLTET